MLGGNIVKFRSLPLISQSLFLSIFLFANAAVGRFIPSSGVLVVGVVVAVSIEITRLRFPKNPAAATLVMFSTMALLWGWTGPYMGIFARPTAFLMFLGWGVYCLLTPINATQRVGSMLGIAVLALSIIIHIQDSHHMATLLLWGYDNSAHIPGLSQVYRHAGFLYSGNLPDFFYFNFTFSNYLNGYPPLQTGTWAFIMSIADVRINGGYEILNYFGFFLFATAIYIVFEIASYWISGLSRWLAIGHESYKTATCILIALLIACSQVSYMFWMGFPPFLWACAIIIAVLKLGSNLGNQSDRLLLGLLGSTLVNYSYPVLSPVFVLVLLYELSKMTKVDYSNIWIKKKTNSAFVIVACVLNVPVMLKTLSVRHYVDDAGGIQPTEPNTLIPIVFVVTVMSFAFKYSRQNKPRIVVAFFASVLNFVVLALWSLRNLEYISYYPQKAGYLVLMLSFASMGSMIGESPRFSRPIYKRFVPLIVATISIGLLGISVRATTSSSLAGWPSTLVVWAQRDKPFTGWKCFHNAMDVTSDLNTNSNLQTILYLNDDSGTRWINGVRGRLTEATYSLSIPVGQGKQSLSEILEVWFVLYPQARLLILAPEPPVGLEKWGEKIEYRHFACA